MSRTDSDGPGPGANEPPPFEDLLAELVAHRPKLRLAISAGGTGGHVFPAFAALAGVRRLIAQSGIDLSVLFLGAGDLERKAAEHEGVPFVEVRAGKIRRSRNPLLLVRPANLVDIARIPLGVGTALRALHRFQPDAVLCTGGYVSVPTAVASLAMRTPVLIHEQTVGLGLANRFMALAASKIALGSASSLRQLPRRAKNRAIVTGTPVRPDLLHGDAERAVRALGWGSRPAVPTVLVTGGVQGSVQINSLITAVLPELLESARVVHQCGQRSIADARDTRNGLPIALRDHYQPLEFIDGELLRDVFALADIVVCRSGAGTLAELTTLGLASVLVPLVPSAADEQARNARTLADVGAAEVLVGPDATSARLMSALRALLSDPERRTRMANAATSMSHIHADERLASELLRLAMPST